MEDELIPCYFLVIALIVSVQTVLMLLQCVTLVDSTGPSNLQQQYYVKLRILNFHRGHYIKPQVH